MKCITYPVPVPDPYPLFGFFFSFLLSSCFFSCLSKVLSAISSSQFFFLPTRLWPFALARLEDPLCRKGKMYITYE